MSTAEDQRTLYATRKAQGLCIQCGEPSMDGNYTCEFHSLRRAELSRARA